MKFTKNINKISGLKIMSIIALIKVQEDVFIILNKDFSVAGFSSIEEGCQKFTAAYDINHERGHQASMSALIHNMQFQPRIVEIADDDLEKTVDLPTKISRLSAASGSYLGVKIKPEWHKLYDEGTSPDLMTVED